MAVMVGCVLMLVVVVIQMLVEGMVIVCAGASGCDAC